MSDRSRPPKESPPWFAERRGIDHWLGWRRIRETQPSKFKVASLDPSYAEPRSRNLFVEAELSARLNFYALDKMDRFSLPQRVNALDWLSLDSAWQLPAIWFSMPSQQVP